MRQTRWTDRYAQRTQTMRSSTVRELLKLTTQPDLISFAGGLPGADLFPIDQALPRDRRSTGPSNRPTMHSRSATGDHKKSMSVQDRDEYSCGVFRNSGENFGVEDQNVGTTPRNVGPPLAAHAMSRTRRWLMHCTTPQKTKVLVR